MCVKLRQCDPVSRLMITYASCDQCIQNLKQTYLPLYFSAKYTIGHNSHK